MFAIVFFAIIIYLLVKLVKWLTAPSYIHKIGNVYYETGSKELSEKQIRKIRKMKNNNGEKGNNNILEFILVKLPLVLWVIVTVFYLLCDFMVGMMVAVITGIPVIVWILIMKWCLTTEITYKVHTSKQSKKRN